MRLLLSAWTCRRHGQRARTTNSGRRHRVVATVVEKASPSNRPTTSEHGMGVPGDSCSLRNPLPSRSFRSPTEQHQPSVEVRS